MSTTSLDDLNVQIQKLEAQRAQLHAEAEKKQIESKAKIVRELIDTISTYGITAKELGLKTEKLEKVGKSKSARKPLGAKIAENAKMHTGPDGQTWTEGTRGRKPAWLKEQFSETAEAA